MRITLIRIAIVSACAVNSLADEPNQTLQFSKWSGAVNVPDPVAISFDNAGTAYVTQTQRRKSQDLDIRQHQEWIPNDVSFKSVEEKRAFYKSALAIGQDEINAQHVDDHNKDGHYDYRDLTVISERIHLLRDTDNDGTADFTQVFADDFKTEVTGIAAGVLHFDDVVYATIAPDVWRLRDTNEDGTADDRSVMATGFGLHIAYAGHDMHGLTVGPDGKIYWSVGDKGISVTSQEGRKYDYPNQGGVMRCNPDGSDFEVFAHGLRNVQELAFDQYGNLFGVDNDADKPTEQERFVYIVRDMDAGWRCNYQYRGSDYDPWMAEKLWQPWHEGQPSYILPPIRNYVDGPAGFAFNPGTALSPQYKDFFFLTEAPKGRQYAFQVEPNGASFRMVNDHLIGEGVAMVGINFGPDGGLYGVDWGGGYPLNQSGAVWKIDDPKFEKSQQRIQVRELLNSSFASRDSQKLQQLLLHADQRIRLRSQFEVAKRNDVNSFVDVIRSDAAIVPKCHAIWGLGQIARKYRDGKVDTDAKKAVAALTNTLSAQEPELIAQALRTIGDLESFDSVQVVPLLTHSAPRVQFMAASVLGRHGSNDAVPALVKFAGTLGESDTYLRFGLMKALSNSAKPEQLAAFSDHKNRILQLAAVVALRRLRSPQVANFLNSQDSQVSSEAARAIHDDRSIPEALPMLADSLNDVSGKSEDYVRRAINSNFRLRNSVPLAEFAATSKGSETLRLEALLCLQDWYHLPSLDKVTGRHREFPKSKANLPLDELATLISTVASDSSHQLRAAALLASAELGIRLSPSSLVAIVSTEYGDGDTKIAALKALESQEYPNLSDVAAGAMKSNEPAVRIAALAILVGLQRDGSLGRVKFVLENSDDIAERQHAITLLADIEDSGANEALMVYIGEMSKGLHPELWLEIGETAQSVATDVDVAVALGKARASLVQKSSDPAAEFAECLVGGNAANGRELFLTHLSAQCIRCHRIGKTGSQVGPNLRDVGIKRDATHILRSIIAPSVDIDKRYRTQVVVLISGKTLQGVLLKEDKFQITLADSQGKTTLVDREEIDEIFEQKISIMPEMKKTLNRREIRDIVAFLQTQKSGK